MNNINNNSKIESEIIKRYLWTSIIVAICLGVIMIAFVSGYSAKMLSHYFNGLGCGILIAGASVSTGGLLGFIFGIPSISQGATATLKYNDNLVQISDWLTKIIVGVGLTQLYTIPHFVIRIGEHFQENFGGDTWGRNVAIAIIGYFFVLGFLMIFFWTKTDYSTIMKNMDDDLNKKLKETEKKLEDETKEKETAQMEKNQTVKELESVIEEKHQADQKLETIKQDSEIKGQDIQAVFQTFSSTADELKENLQLKNVRGVADDPQKGKWGGKAESNGRKLSAIVRETTFDKEWFNVNLEVRSTDINKPLKGDVTFHLHPSFPNSIKTIPVENGSANLQIVAYGAFTVGAECDNGQTLLELDLSELQEVPQLFRDR